MTRKKHNIPLEADGDSDEAGKLVWHSYCPICYYVVVIKNCIETDDPKYDTETKLGIIKSSIEIIDKWRLK